MSIPCQIPWHDGVCASLAGIKITLIAVLCCFTFARASLMALVRSRAPRRTSCRGRTLMRQSRRRRQPQKARPAPPWQTRGSIAGEQSSPPCRFVAPARHCDSAAADATPRDCQRCQIAAQLARVPRRKRAASPLAGRRGSAPAADQERVHASVIGQAQTAALVSKRRTLMPASRRAAVAAW